MSKLVSALKRCVASTKYNAKQVMEHWYKMSHEGEEKPSQKDMDEWIEHMGGSERLKNTTWEIKEIPINKIKPHHSSYKDTFGKENVDLYKEWRTENGTELPPIIVDEIDGGYETFDGAHRLEAAKQLGDKTIRAYVPVK